MGTGKKEASRRQRQGKTGDGMANVKVKGESFYRDAKRVKQLNMFKEGKAQRNKDGKIIQAASYQSRDVPTAVIEPNRKWFGNTRVISQDSLKSFREAMAERANDPYQVLLKSNKLPMSLIRDGSETNGLKKHRAKMTLESSPYSEIFGSKSTRKRVKLDVSSLADLADGAEKDLDTYKDRLEQQRLLSGNAGPEDGPIDHAAEEDTAINAAIEPIFTKGQSKRIWNELYRTIDSSDVLIHVLDARDPLGTRCRSVEKYLKEEAPHKHLIFLLNKCDLVPTSVAAKWVKILQKEVPTAAFRASVTQPFGKGSVIGLLRQFSSLHSDRKQISVGLVGYPNVGKSSVINALRGKASVKVAPIPGETKVWQYVTLMKRIFLIDCPGIVPPDQQASPEILILRGTVRTEKVENPAQYIPAVLKKVKPQHLKRTYDLDYSDIGDHIRFLEALARKSGRLLKGGEPDVDGVARIILNDFMRGKIPWFTPPPQVQVDETENSDRTGRLGEMKKRKRDDAESVADTSVGATIPTAMKSKPEEAEDDNSDFEGFGSDSDPGEMGSSDEDEDSVESTVGTEDVILLESSDDDASEVDEEEGENEPSEEEVEVPQKKAKRSISSGSRKR
ncbi:uncharacterized protein E0L32_011253 [Thyridium curvatum]|uniref:Nucleolar GTP-binding protein 2 n=1 Tax=Thyridium curvatum TaxID=1093900 RepID=A0A507B9T4_9PEZI|nr:uncharacterized protein E0L32_011253 [Thyridium curvatum]TPX19092.1 hypothetical protein E0L32_011253 [Thyridium curvatum]